MKIKDRNTLLFHAGIKICRAIDKYLDKNNIFINLFNSGVVIDSKKTVTKIKRLFKKKQ